MENYKKLIQHSLLLTLLLILLPVLTRLVGYQISGFTVLSYFLIAFAFLSFIKILRMEFYSPSWKAHMTYIITSVLIAIAMIHETVGAGIGLGVIGAVIILSLCINKQETTKEEPKER